MSWVEGHPMSMILLGVSASSILVKDSDGPVAVTTTVLRYSRLERSQA